MKCPICGNDHFINIEFPFNTPGNHVRCDGCYGCTNCGYVFFKTDDAPHRIKQIREWLQIKETQIRDMDKMIENVISNSKNVEYEKKVLKSYKEELAYRKKKGEDNKTTRSLIESIKQLEPIVKAGCQIDTEQRLEEYNRRKREYELEKENILKSIKYFEE